MRNFKPNTKRMAPPKASPYPPTQWPNLRPRSKPAIDIPPPNKPNRSTASNRSVAKIPSETPTENASMLTIKENSSNPHMVR